MKYTLLISLLLLRLPGVIFADPGLAITKVAFTGVSAVSGQAVAVTVSVSPVPTNPLTVFVTGPFQEVGTSVTGTAASYTLNFTIAQGIAPGIYGIGAGGSVAQTGSPLNLYAAPAPIRIELAQPIVSLIVPTRKLRLRYPGAQTEVSISGRLADGTVVPLRKSSRLLLDPPNFAIVSVATGGSGNITAVAPGTAQVQVRYSNPSGTTPANIVTYFFVQVLSTGVRGDLDGDGDVDLDDIAILQSWLNQPSATQFDSRDLNFDGRIDALDARILTTLCTRPRCATK